MVDGAETKVCPLCAETIKAAAKVCPHCRKIQNRLFFLSRYDLTAVMGAILLLVSCILIFNAMTQARVFSPAHDKIIVLNSQFTVEADRYSTNLMVMGMLTNASDYAWAIRRLEVRFFDGAGTMTDTDAGASLSLVVPAHTEHSFRLPLYSKRSVPAYSRYEILVTSALEPGFWLADD